MHIKNIYSRVSNRFQSHTETHLHRSRKSDTAMTFMLQQVSFPQSFCSSRCQEREGDSPVLGRAKNAKGEVLKRDHYGGTRRDHTAHSDMSSEGGDKRRMSDKVRSTAQTQNRQQHERQTGEGRAQKNPEPFSRTHRTWQGPETASTSKTSASPQRFPTKLPFLLQLQP